MSSIVSKVEKLKLSIRLAECMWRDLRVYQYQNLELASSRQKSVFLAGPSSRQDIMESKWRVFAVNHLRQAGYRGVIYVPEPREDDWSFKKDFPMEIVDWEIERLMSCSIKMFWIPRHEVQLPGRVTNTELGFQLGRAYENPKLKEKIIWGYPSDAWKVKSELHWARLSDIEPFNDLGNMCKYIAQKLNNKNNTATK